MKWLNPSVPRPSRYFYIKKQGCIFFSCLFVMFEKCCVSLQWLIKCYGGFSLNTGRKWNVHKTFRRLSSGRPLNVLYTFSLRPVSSDSLRYFRYLTDFDVIMFSLSNPRFHYPLVSVVWKYHMIKIVTKQAYQIIVAF